jgi:hypothetical protein
MKETNSTIWHFPVMVAVSCLIFFLVIRMVIGRQAFVIQFWKIFFLSMLVIIVGMLFGKYGQNLGLPWWIYYPVPMLMNVLLPPLILKLNKNKMIRYLILSFLSAPLIHIFFSFFFNWTEYMPFWKIPFIGTLIG